MKQENLATSVIFDPERLAPFMGPTIVELYTAFANSTSAILEQIDRSLTNKDQKDLTFIIHKLKGTSGNVGAKRLHAISSELELFAKAGKFEKIAEFQKVFKEVVVETVLAINSYLSKFDLQGEMHENITATTDAKEVDVFIIDDDEGIGSFLQLLVKDLGLTSKHITDPKLFWQEFPEGCKLVILDRMMPERDGLSILQEIRQQYSHQQLPVIMATSKTQDEDVILALQSGASDYVYKPINPEIARRRIMIQVESHQNLKNAVQAEEAKTIESMIITYNHEINNPLTILFAIQEKLENGKLKEKDIGKIRTNLERIANIVRQIKGLNSSKTPATSRYANGQRYYNVIKKSG